MTAYRFYDELAPWWPLISPPEEYLEEATYLGGLLASSAAVPVHTVLELGSGGGHNAVHLKSRFTLTLVDLSPEMIAVSRALNPTCEHLVGDMRSLRLDRTFDAVFLHDAIDYMTTESDLRAAMETAYRHTRPGGIALFVPDQITETYEPDTDHGGTDAPDGRGVRYLQWTTDPDPTDTTITTDYVFLLRTPTGHTRTLHETHHTALFPRETWLDLLTSTGFTPTPVTETTTEPRTPRQLFVAHRPPTP